MSPFPPIILYSLLLFVFQKTFYLLTLYPTLSYLIFLVFALILLSYYTDAISFAYRGNLPLLFQVVCF